MAGVEGRVALVTGASQGIGRACALVLAKSGAKLALCARNQEKLEQLAGEINGKGGEAAAFKLDVSHEDEIKTVVKAAIARFGKVDILVNSAGKIKRAPTLTFPEDDWREIIDTNLTGALRACQIFGKHMLERGYGRIINIASLNSFVALSEVAAYAASKAGVASLTRSLAVEWSKQGVLVNAIAPGVFRTALNAQLLDSTPRGKELLMRTPMGRFGKTEEVVGAAVYLASEAASFVTGQVLVIDGGFLASGVNQ